MPGWKEQDQEGTSPRQPKVPETAQSKCNLLAVNHDQGETEKLPIKKHRMISNNKEIRGHCLITRILHEKKETQKKKKIEAKNRLGAVRQIPSPAKAAAPGSYAALPVQPSLLLSSELYSNLQNVFFSCRNTRISPHPPHLGAHLS